MTKEYKSVFGPPGNCPGYWTTPDEIRRFREEFNLARTGPDGRPLKTRYATSAYVTDTSKGTSADRPKIPAAEGAAHSDGQTMHPERKPDP